MSQVIYCAIYIVLGVFLFITSLLLLLTIVLQRRLREKYNVFAVKFVVDLVTGVSLIIAGSLNPCDKTQCGIIWVISTSIPLLQALLLLSEVVDWSLAAFSPIYFHTSSLLCRFLPFFIGLIFCSFIMISLIVLDTTTNNVDCVSSPTATAVVSAYDVSLFIITLCLIGLVILLMNHLRSSFFRPVLFHFLATLFFQQIPLLAVIALKYSSNNSATIRFTSDITNFCFALHAMAHTAFFFYNNQEIRKGTKALIVRFLPIKINFLSNSSVDD